MYNTLGTKYPFEGDGCLISFSPERLRSNLVTAIPFDRQKKRPPFVNSRRGPNEHRFENINKSPKIHSGSVYVSKTKFDKSDPHNTEWLKKKELFLNDYCPKLDYVRQSLALGIPNFNKYIDRSPNEVPSPC